MPKPVTKSNLPLNNLLECKEIKISLVEATSYKSQNIDSDWNSPNFLELNFKKREADQTL